MRRKEPAYDQSLVRTGTSDRAKHTGTLLCNAQGEDYFVFGPNSRPALDQSKTRWDKDRFGRHNPRPKIYDQDAAHRVKAIQGAANSCDDHRFPMSSKDSLTQRALRKLH